MDQSGSTDDLAETHLSVPSSSPQRRRSSSVHTLKCAHPQRVISCRSHSRSHSDSMGHTEDPPSPVRSQTLTVPAGDPPQPAPPPNRLSAPQHMSQGDEADSEVSQITSSGHALSHTEDKSRHLSGRLSQSASPVSGKNRKHRVSPPPPGDRLITMTTQLTDSSVELRRRTLSFDATSLSPHPPDGSSQDD